MTGALLLWLVPPTAGHLGLGVLIGRRQASEPGPCHDRIGSVLDLRLVSRHSHWRNRAAGRGV
jgi:hypothetical protein